MFEFTNEQRKCFGLPPLADFWDRVTVKPSPYDDFSTIAYLDRNRVQWVLMICEHGSKIQYQEMQIDAVLSADRKMLLPKTGKGKPKLFSSSNLLKRGAVGMYFCYVNGYISIKNQTSAQTYYHSAYEDVNLKEFAAFEKWVQAWCASTGEQELREIWEFSAAKRIHQKYREGDFFRFRINRSLYGYGRLLIDFEKMRKASIPFLDIFIGKPLCAAVYHIVTGRDDVSPEELVGLPALPPQMIMDDRFFYGEYATIGNMPVSEAEHWDYPIHYGHTISVLETGTRYQCGRTFIALDDLQPLYSQYRNNGISWDLNVKSSVLQKCIESGSNQPYWDMYCPYTVEHDLRNPKFRTHLMEIRRQVGLNKPCI